MDAFNHRFNQTELDHGQIPKELRELGKDVCSILFYVSICCCTLVLLGYGFIRYFDPAHDRLTLRLLIYASIAHIVLSISGIFRTDSSILDNNPGCQAVMFFYVFSNLFSTIAITCIAINLQIVFVHSVKGKHHFERWYVLASSVPAFVIAIVPIFPKVEGYHYSQHLSGCWYLQSSQHTNLWALMGLYLWLLVSTAYCIIALILVLRKMYAEELRINKHLGGQNETHRKWFYRWPLSLLFRPPRNNQTNAPPGDLEEPRTEEHHHLPLRPSNLRHMVSSRVQMTLKNVKGLHTRQLKMSYLAKVAGRVIWFPAILVLTRIWGVIGFLISYTTRRVNPFMLLMSYVSVPMQGIFLLFIFLFDPSLHHAVRAALGRRDSVHEQGPTSLEKMHSPQFATRHPNIDVLQSPSGYSFSGDLSLSTWGSYSHTRSSSMLSTSSFPSNSEGSSPHQDQPNRIIHPLPSRSRVDPPRATSGSVPFTNSYPSNGSFPVRPSSYTSSSRRPRHDRTFRRGARSMGEAASSSSVWDEFRQL